MIELTTLGAFAAICLGMVLTPGPNMIYLVSRSICQGRAAGLISLGGVALGFIVYMLCATLGLTAFLMALPYAFDALRLGGALYLAWLAWNALRPAGGSPFQVRELPPDSPGRLFSMGFLTSLLNPKVAMFYLSLLPQFIDLRHGDVLLQGMALGSMQICISVTVNCLFIFTAGTISTFLANRPQWARAQRSVMGVTLGALAIRMALIQK
ncbi:LysE family translocator [Chromobacterium piscinae]|uniref:LysE family translocator n=1 Tax=Chromobacterium piscinae TaxID=686831 RepID=A0ABV0GZX0_9NEIS|nr:LysE family translocator [Chromobacterium piscinae]MBX9298058.1 LysE family translocator [Chromobacterium vaccinii]MBX9348885.1 LysE family translocator [Chromobacterium vaccinii]MBX9355483.1 LysE family translocator [Chromobacterium vaccinii]MCD4506273.1 LysE family translocator [Chromobacterium piscinae]MCD5326618.1 LysE family translocator [Chromobacterium piscinae]